MSEHAKGPWKIHPVDDTSVIDATGAEVACVGGDYNQPETWPIMEANARLIARAPEMAEEIERLTDEVATLKGQLPEGMEHCKILFEECPVGHGHLRGDNWIKHECDHCKVLALTARVEELEGDLNIMRLQRDAKRFTDGTNPRAAITKGESHD